jgi:hypothetical protein
VDERQDLRLEILDSRDCLVQHLCQCGCSTLIDFVREPSDALEDSLVLTELIGLLAPKLNELDRELFEVRFSLGGHVPFIGRRRESMKTRRSGSSCCDTKSARRL